jgi:hypothetical protein
MLDRAVLAGLIDCNPLPRASGADRDPEVVGCVPFVPVNLFADQ